MTKHTPGQIKFSRDNDGIQAFRLAANGLIIADVLFKVTIEHAPSEQEAEANATRLALAWNCHDELVEALKGLLAATAANHLPGIPEIEDAQSEASAALSKVEVVK